MPFRASINDSSSTYSASSKASTLKGVETMHKKWFAMKTKSAKPSFSLSPTEALHNEAVASYFSMR
ncbi:uncharacterized protein ACLA_007180 [Aspergillus clavatus NRRL 1]|uniref:Uncharacterized protein n=1 Tax=Aspergillus clavatus (strain ATCC 1007 / CBS 513.65 / DSM 816 / NCTC 3887 / NRRL 1 / QM 1276 / 107) TaxID=344612 RepID=A1CDN2_ASPCL|nr:uncharacterized protein ACLA_007180 [Aspergillus clavatus NRRL 1]EAW11959.1 conserved hypothetical protein [Aspergillus clavatus NRRL 1]